MKRNTWKLTIALTAIIACLVACSQNEPETATVATSTGTILVTTTPTTQTEPIVTTTTPPTSASTTETTTEPTVPLFSAESPWVWWELSETIVPYFSAAHQSLDETEPWSILRVLGADAYVPIEPLAEEITADTYNAVYIQIWDVGEAQGEEVHTAWMYTDETMRQMILADRGQFWRIESEVLYEYFAEQALNFGRIRSALTGLDEDTVAIGFNDGNGQAYPVVTAHYLEHELATLADYAWVVPEQSDLPLTGMEYSVHLYAPDGSSLTLFADSEFVRWQDMAGDRFYRLVPKQPNAGWEQGQIAETMRRAYAEAATSYRQIAFSHQGTPEEVVEYFAKSAYGDSVLCAPKGTMYSVLDYAALSWRIDRVSEDGKTIVGGLGYAVLPENSEGNVFLAGNGQFGTGEYEGWIVAGRSFRLVLGEDGLWRCDEMATGVL